MNKFKCPLCNNECSDISRHLVIVHNIKDIDHLRNLIKKSSENKELIINEFQQTPIKELDINLSLNLRKELILTTLRIKGEPIIKERKKHITKLGSLLKQIVEDTVLLNEGIDILLNCLKDNNPIIKEQAIIELKELIKLNKIDEEIKTKIKKITQMH